MPLKPVIRERKPVRRKDRVMSNRKQWFLLLLLSAVLVGCSKNGTETAQPEEISAAGAMQTESIPLYLSMATNGDWSVSQKGKILEDEIESLKERTEGGIKIRLYDRSRLGNDAHLISGVQAGTIDIVQSSPAMQINAVPEAALLDIPGLFDTLEEWNDLLQGDYRKTMEEYYEKAGLVFVDAFAYSWRNLTSRVPVTNPEDLAGLKIRTLENKYQEAYWNSLGAEAVPYRYEELYFCLHEGLADAQENIPDLMLADNLHEVQNSMTMTRHLPMVSVIAMNRERFDSMTAEEQEELRAFTDSLREQLIRQMPEEDERILETLEHDYGITILEPSASLKEQMNSGREVILQMLREDLGEGPVEDFLEAAEKSEIQ